MELDIKLGINSTGQLVTLDDTVMDHTDHVSLEYLLPVDVLEDVKKNDLIVCPELYTKGQYNTQSIFDLDQDGTWVYIKLGVPNWDHFNVDSTITKGTIFVVPGDTEHFYVVMKEFEKSSDEFEVSDSVKELQMKSLLLAYYAESRVPGANTQTLYFEKKIFSVWKLQQCLVNLQRELLDKVPCSCEACSTDKDTIYRRDFLLASMYVFDYLKDIGNFEKAQLILDKLNSSCNWLCQESSHENDCGCGKAKY